MASQSSGKMALDHVIAAAELYMNAVPEAKSAAERSRLRRKFRELMAYGERLKAATAPVESSMSSLSISGVASRPTQVRVNHDPSPSRELPKKEQIIILRSSRLHGSVFPPWDTEPAHEFFSLSASGDALYE